MGKLSIHSTQLSDVYIINTDIFHDERGAFARWFDDSELNLLLKDKRIVNINYSKTLNKGSVRGLHYQLPPNAETKIVRCIHGKIIDVVVDIRKQSPTFLQHHTFELSEDNMTMLYVPEGFAHGFQSLEDNTEIMYLVTNYYSPTNERGLNPLDPKLKIKWPLPIADISNKDKERPYLTSAFNGVVIEKKKLN